MVKKLIKSKKIKDSDDDGLSDFDEINIFGSDPYNADSDGDGIEDGEAVLNGHDPVGGGPLKDFFIPHAGNNYQPKALLPKRVLFHAVSAIMIKAVVVIFVSFYPLLAWMTPDIAAAEGQKIIALTNELRKQLSLKTLVENSLLDSAAAKKVEDMFINQYFAHVSPRGFGLEHFLALVGYKNYAVVGENLAMGYESAAEAMAAWKKSPTHYANLTDENYSQIGVALAGGLYFKSDTIFIAQYFGLPQTAEIVETAKKIRVSTNIDKIIPVGDKAVLAEKTAVTPVPIVPKKVTQLPILTREEAQVIIDTPSGKPTEKVVKVEVVLPSETTSAVAQVENNNIVLFPAATSIPSAVSPIAIPTETLWTGQAVVVNNKADNVSIVPPTIIVTDKVGNMAQVMVDSESVKPQKTSILDQYFLFRTHPTKGLNNIFEISSIYFKILLGLVLIVLSLNIFIRIKKQSPKIIIPGLGLIILLVMLIVF